MEAVLLSTPTSFIFAEFTKGKKWAIVFKNLKQNINKPLSAILSLNTVAHTVGAAGVGAQAVKVFGETYFGIVSAILTLLILVFTEIIPKTLGATYWRRFAKFTAYIIKILIIITYPLVVLSSFLTRLISSGDSENTISREEFSALASIGVDDGILSENEHKIIQIILRLKNIKVTGVMTPRIVVSSADVNMSLMEFLKNKEYLYFSRIPVYEGDEENITGYVLRQTVFEKIAENNKALTLNDIKRNIVIVPNTKPLFGVWESLLNEREHIALIVDEYGGMDGIVTMEDIIETILGLEIIDEKDVVTDMQQYARERWKMRQKKYNLLKDNNDEDNLNLK